MALDRLTELDEGDLLDRKDSESTRKIVKASVAVLQHYLEAKGKQLQELEIASSEDCDDLLKTFYVETRKEDGRRYAKKSMVTLRYGLQKHFLRIREQDIINDKIYSRSNEMFKAVLIKLKEDGVGECVQTVPVTPEDLAILYGGSAFDTHTPEGLQRKVMFEYLYYFSSRGRENLRGLKRSDFIVGVDSSGRDYVAVGSKPKKNARGEDVHDIDNKQSRMYDRPGDPSCPVAAFKKYVDKLHTENSNFWQRPKKNATEEDIIWYENVPVGKNTLYSFMQKLSQEFRLSKRYTNHCVRATSIATLDHNGVEARHIMSVTGHRNETSIKSYSFRLSDDKKRQMSDILSENIAPPSKCVKRCAAATGSRNTVCLMGQSFPHSDAQTQPHVSNLQEQINTNINRLSVEISEPELHSMDTHTRQTSKEMTGENSTMVKETKMDKIKEREKIAAVLKKAVLSLCQEKYHNPIEVDALICVAVTPTDNHVVKIHETIGNLKDQPSEVSLQDANDGQNTCNVSSTWSTVQNSKPKTNSTIYEDLLMESGSDSTAWQANENPENLSGLSTSNSTYQGPIYDKVNMYLGTDVFRNIENSVMSTKPTELVSVASGLVISNNTASTLVYPISTQSQKVPIAKTSICRKRPLDHGDIQRSLVTQKDKVSQNYAMIKERSEDRQYHQKVSEIEQDFSLNNAERSSTLTSSEAFPGDIMIKEEPLWINDTGSKWSGENQKNRSGVEYCENSNMSNSSKQYLQSQLQSPDHEVPLEMSVTSIKEEPWIQESDTGEPEMEIDTDIDTSQLDIDCGMNADNSYSVTGLTHNSGPSKILKVNSLAEAYKISVPRSDSKEEIPLLTSLSNTGENKGSSQLMFQLPFV
ncbi:uncharacterized protein LOC117329407 [Pecten maximus]|uniref:uncharacterized protein LOC117329407 n=1 Tax=Pecten maximus TaxID=6579 RepID=UPI0014585F7F|nr:uncharacterized protein LOC117329407 [Pecten maximus]